MTRDEMITHLVNDSLDTINSPDGSLDADQWILEIFHIGLKGFNSYTDDELRQELENRDIEVA